MILVEEIAAAQARVLGAGGEHEFVPAALSPAAVAALIDHTLLKPEAGEEQVRALVAEAVRVQIQVRRSPLQVSPKSRIPCTPRSS